MLEYEFRGCGCGSLSLDVVVHQFKLASWASLYWIFSPSWTHTKCRYHLIVSREPSMGL